MNKITQLHAARLARVYGNYSEAARRIGLMPRTFRLNRCVKTSKVIGALIRHAANALFLRLLLRELRASGAVSDPALKAALHNVHGILAAQPQSMCQNEEA